MFKSYRILNKRAVVFPSADAFIIEDDDFKEEILVNRQGVEDAVITLYERRHLPILPNLMRCILYAIGMRHATFHEIKTLNPERLHLYLQDLERYLVLG